MQTNSELPVITLDLNKSHDKEIGLRGIARNIKYINLELKPECIIGTVTELSAARDYFFLVNKEDHELYQFTRTGKFIRKIGKAGRGPGEYPAIIDLSVDESKGRVFVLTDFLRQILVYDFNGTYINSIHIPDRIVQSIEYIGNRNEISGEFGNVLNNISQNDNPVIMVIDVSR